MTRPGKAAGAQALGVPEQLAYRENMAHRKPVTRQPRKRRKKAKPLKAPERSGFFPVVTSTLLSMICTTTVFATVLAVLLGIAKWTKSQNRLHWIYAGLWPDHAEIGWFASVWHFTTAALHKIRLFRKEDFRWSETWGPASRTAHTRRVVG
jgi:hypothetical protein